MVFVPIVRVFDSISMAGLMFYDLDRSMHHRKLRAAGKYGGERFRYK